MQFLHLIQSIYNKKELYFCFISLYIGVLLIDAQYVISVMNYYVLIAILNTSEYQFILYSLTVIIITVRILDFPILHSLLLADLHWL